MFGTQTDQKFYVDLRQKFLAVILQMDKGCSSKTHKTKKVEKVSTKESKVAAADQKIEKVPSLCPYSSYKQHLASNNFQ